MNGIVINYQSEKGFGFIEPLIGKPGAKTVFFHAAAVTGIKAGEQPGIPMGCEVSFDLVRGHDGVQAANLRVVKVSAARLWPENPSGVNP